MGLAGRRPRERALDLGRHAGQRPHPGRYYGCRRGGNCGRNPSVHRRSCARSGWNGRWRSFRYYGNSSRDCDRHRARLRPQRDPHLPGRIDRRRVGVRRVIRVFGELRYALGRVPSCSRSSYGRARRLRIQSSELLPGDRLWNRHSHSDGRNCSRNWSSYPGRSARTFVECRKFNLFHCLKSVRELTPLVRQAKESVHDNSRVQGR